MLLEVNKRLKDYQLDIQAVPPETQDVMMESGDAKVATGGYFKNAQREQNFLLPESPIGASSLMVYVLKGNENKYNSFEDVVKANLKLVPLTPNGGAYRIVDEGNKKHGNLLKEYSRLKVSTINISLSLKKLFQKLQQIVLIPFGRNLRCGRSA